MRERDINNHRKIVMHALWWRLEKKESNLDMEKKSG